MGVIGDAHRKQQSKLEEGYMNAKGRKYDRIMGKTDGRKRSKTVMHS